MRAPNTNEQETHTTMMNDTVAEGRSTHMQTRTHARTDGRTHCQRSQTHANERITQSLHTRRKRERALVCVQWVLGLLSIAGFTSFEDSATTTCATLFFLAACFDATVGAV